MFFKTHLHFCRTAISSDIVNHGPRIREQILVPNLYVLTVESVANKKRKKKRLKPEKKKFQKIYFMQLFSTDATIFKTKFLKNLPPKT